MPSKSSSFTPFMATALIFTASPAAFAAKIPSRIGSILPQRVIWLNFTGSSVSSDTFTRRTPEAYNVAACLLSCVPFVVTVSSFRPWPIFSPSAPNRRITSRRTSGSPPVMRIFVVPRRMKAEHRRSSSSSVSNSFLGRKLMSSDMQ